MEGERFKSWENWFGFWTSYLINQVRVTGGNKLVLVVFCPWHLLFLQKILVLASVTWTGLWLVDDEAYVWVFGLPSNVFHLILCFLCFPSESLSCPVSPPSILGQFGWRWDRAWPWSPQWRTCWGSRTCRTRTQLTISVCIWTIYNFGH